MKHIERELHELRKEVAEMWELVISQLKKAKQAFSENDIELALEIAGREKRINAFELKIDSDCENYIALYSPVAIDLRLTLSLMKICGTLERIGDFADGIARHVIEGECDKVSKHLTEELQITKMFDILIDMLTDGYIALKTENTKLTGKILASDEQVDEIYNNSLQILTRYLGENSEYIYCGLKLLLLIRKLERIGDHCSNIAEEIVFYVDAKVLKHSKWTSEKKE